MRKCPKNVLVCILASKNIIFVIPNKKMDVGFTIASILSILCLRLCSYWHALLYHDFRARFYKIGRSKSDKCRYGCNCTEDFTHVLFHCKTVVDERRALNSACISNSVTFDLKNIMTLPCLQIPMERLLLSFFTTKA